MVKWSICFDLLADAGDEIQRTTYGRTHKEELLWDLENHGTMVAGIIKEKGPYNIRFYNIKVGLFCAKSTT